MAITKHALIRYQTLDRCFRNPGRKYYITDLLDACNSAIKELEPDSKGIQKRQLYDDIRFMESSQGWHIPLERVKEGRKTFLRYEDTTFSINNQPINELEAEQLKSAMLVLNRFKGLPQFEWINELLPKLDQTFQLSNQSDTIISFDNNEFLFGTEHLSPLFNSILYKQTLTIIYRSFKSEIDSKLTFYPYHLKQHNNRWFLFGKSGDFQNLTNLALDRIVSIDESNQPYIENTSVDFNEYFEDIIGVTRPEGKDLITILLQANASLAPYVKTKPLHGSQKSVNATEDQYTFTIEVIPNYELEKLLLSFGEGLTIISPDDFKQKMKTRALAILNNFD